MLNITVNIICFMIGSLIGTLMGSFVASAGIKNKEFKQYYQGFLKGYKYGK